MKQTKSDYRRARTRTLIQLGGLIEKSGLAELLTIELGQDLQTEEEALEAAATLYGALLDLKQTLLEDSAPDQQKLLWFERGKKALGG